MGTVTPDGLADRPSVARTANKRRKCCHPVIRGVLMPTATMAAHDGAAATDATVAQVTETVVAALSQTSTVAGDIVASTTGAVTPLVQSAAGKARELSVGFAAGVKNVAGLT